MNRREVEARLRRRASRDPVLRWVREAAAGSGIEVWLVGGYVRDVALGRAAQDVDLVGGRGTTRLARALEAAWKRRHWVHAMAGEREDLRGRVLVVKDLAAYQEGAVASRTVVLKKAGTVTAFAFDAGEGLPEHTAPYDAMVQGLEGEAEITIGRKPLHLSEGQMVIMPARITHAVKALTRFRMLLTMIHE